MSDIVGTIVGGGIYYYFRYTKFYGLIIIGIILLIVGYLIGFSILNIVGWIMIIIGIFGMVALLLIKRDKRKRVGNPRIQKKLEKVWIEEERKTKDFKSPRGISRQNSPMFPSISELIRNRTYTDKDLEDYALTYLTYNRGKAIIIQGLQNFLQDLKEQHSELDISTENLIKILNGLRKNNIVNSTQENGEIYYYLPGWYVSEKNDEPQPRFTDENLKEITPTLEIKENEPILTNDNIVVPFSSFQKKKEEPILKSEVFLYPTKYTPLEPIEPILNTDRNILQTKESIIDEKGEKINLKSEIDFEPYHSNSSEPKEIHPNATRNIAHSTESIIDKVEESNLTLSPYCTSCGTELTEKAKFCPQCLKIR